MGENWEDEEAGWQILDVIQDDICDYEVLQVPYPYFGKQNIVASFLLLPFLKHDGSQLKVKTKLLKVAVPGTQFVQFDFAFGFFPDVINFSITPNCNSVANIQPKSIHGDPSQVHVLNDGQNGIRAMFEWKLESWKNGHKYDTHKHRPLFKFPKLPYDGTGPILQGDIFPDATWFVSADDLCNLSIQVDLDVRMQFIEYSLLNTPKFYPKLWRYNASYPITRIPIHQQAQGWISKLINSTNACILNCLSYDENFAKDTSTQCRASDEGNSRASDEENSNTGFA